MRHLGLTVLLAVTLFAACSGDDTGTADTTTTTVGTHAVTVRLVADTVGLGCTGSPIHNGTQVVVVAPDGTTLGAGTFQLTQGADSCDWSTTVDDVPTGLDLYTLKANDATLATVDLEQAGWTVDLHATPSGVEVTDG